MPNPHILYPALSLATITFFVMSLVLLTRLHAIRLGNAKMSYFRLSQNNGEVLPEYVLQVTRHLANLFEMPVLFYFLSSLSFTAQLFDPTLIKLFWAYFGFRVCHSIIHLTYNNPEHRVIPYVLSNVVLIASFVRFLFLVS